MKDLSIDDYYEFIDEFVRLCKEKLGNEIFSLFLHGSVASGNFIPGISDIDLFIILKSSNGHVNPDSVSKIARLKNLTLEVTKSQILSSNINIWTYADYELPKRSVFSHPTFQSFDMIEMKHRSKTLLGINPFENLIQLKDEDIVRSVIEQIVWCCYRRRYSSSNYDISRRRQRLEFSIHHWTFRAVKATLALMGIHIGDKHEIMKTFQEHFSDKKSGKVLERIYELWRDKTQFTEKDIVELDNESLILSENLRLLGLSIYDKLINEKETEELRIISPEEMKETWKNVRGL